jgi:hypothetical protein
MWFSAFLRGRRSPRHATVTSCGIEHRIQERRTLRLSAPQLPFCGYRFNASRHAAGNSSMGPVARNGLSLACNDSRSRGPHSRVKAPSLLLRLLADCFRCPFGASTPLPGSGLRPDRAASSLRARYSFRCRLCPQRLRPPLLVGTLTSL